jgi:hypothetical protein
MIRDIRPTDNPEVVVAYGQLFDLEKVLGTAERLVRAIVEMTVSAYPGERAFMQDGPGEPHVPLDDGAMTRLMTGFALEKSAKDGVDIGWSFMRVLVGPFVIRLELMGSDILFLQDDGSYETDVCAPGEELDPSPKFSVCRRDGRLGRLDSRDIILALVALEPFFARGIETGVIPATDGQFPACLFFRFSHEAYGAGEGTMRIRCFDMR